MLTKGSSIAISRSSLVSFTVRRTGGSDDIDPNIRFSATLKTGCPQGSSSYVSGKESARARMRSAKRSVVTPPLWRLDRVGLDAVAEVERVAVLPLPSSFAFGGLPFPDAVEEDHHPDRPFEQDHQRDHLERRRDRIDPRQRDGESGDEDVAEPPVPAQLLGGQDPDPRHRQN